MTNNTTLSIPSTSSGELILTFPIKTSFINSAFAVWNALRSTDRWQSIIRKTWTRRHITFNDTLSVRATKWWSIWINRVLLRSYLWYRLTSKLIASKSWRTRTNWKMINYLTFDTHTAGARTRISAFLIRACFIQVTIRVNGAPRAAGRWITKKTHYARTNYLIIHLSTLLGPHGEGWQECFSTRASNGLHCINVFLGNYTQEYDCTHYKWYSDRMFQYKFLYTYSQCKVAEATGIVINTFGSATSVWIFLISLNIGTYSIVTQCIGTTWKWNARDHEVLILEFLIVSGDNWWMDHHKW